MDKPLRIRLFEEIKRRELSVPEVAITMGIPKDRIYKWIGKQESNPNAEDAVIIEKWIAGKLDNVPRGTSKNDYLAKRHSMKSGNEELSLGMPVYESAPATLSNVESYRDERQDNPDFWLTIPQFRKCNYACRAKGDSMHPLIRNQALVGGVQLQNLEVIIFGDIYIIHTSSGIETIKYIHPDPDNKDGLLLVPYNEIAKTTPIHKVDIIRLYQAQFVLNPI